jgi:hypothetical protein
MGTDPRALFRRAQQLRGTLTAAREPCRAFVPRRPPTTMSTQTDAIQFAADGAAAAAATPTRADGRRVPLDSDISYVGEDDSDDDDVDAMVAMRVGAAALNADGSPPVSRPWPRAAATPGRHGSEQPALTFADAATAERVFGVVPVVELVEFVL